MKGQNLTIRDLPRIERPREKLIKYGVDKLTNTDLLAVILRTGRKGENVISLSTRILKKFTFEKLPLINLNAFKEISGIGESKACEIVACIELGKRLFQNKKTGIAQLLSPQDVFNNLQDIRRSNKEHFIVFFLDSRNQQIHREIVSVGTINASLVHPREVFEPAVKYLSVQVILPHNHPSGDLDPSEDDIKINKRLEEAGKILGIDVLDHIIVSATAFMSFKERGLISKKA